MTFIIYLESNEFWFKFLGYTATGTFLITSIIEITSL